LGLILNLVAMARERAISQVAFGRSEERLRKATTTLSGLLSRIQDKTLGASPALEAMQLDALKRGESLFMEFLEEGSETPEALLKSGITRVHLAGIHELRKDLLRNEDNLKRAIDHFERLALLAPGNSTAHFELAQARTILGHHFLFHGRPDAGHAYYLAARPAYERALVLAPNDVRIVRVASWTMSTCPDVLLRNPERARSLALQGIRLAPEDSRCWNDLAAAESARGAWDECLAAVAQCERLGGQNPAEVWLIAAIAHARRGEQSLARSLFERASELIERTEPASCDYLLLRAEAAALLIAEPSPPVELE
jgi:tetratricopeptide (TPR) repeat protein